MPVSSSTEHWIKPDALTINLNHFGDPDYLQVSVLAGAVVMAFKQDVIGYNAAHNYRTWPLEAANTYLETSSAYNVYARLTRSEVNARALIVYDTVLRDIEGREISYAENGSEVLGDASVDYFFVFLGQISGSVDSNGQRVQREWLIDFRLGSLDTSQYRNEESTGEWSKMFRLNKMTDMIDVLKTISSAIFKKIFIHEKAITDVAVKAEVDESSKVSDTILASTAWVTETVEGRYLRKDKDDRTPFNLGIGKSLSVGESVKVGDFAEGTLGSGASIFMRDGSSYSEVDFLKVRKKATFTNITIQELKHVGGEIILSPAAMVVSKVEELEDGYKCYFDTTDYDGRKVYSYFEIGDQARCQTFNLEHNQYYWRLVTEVKEDDGYIILSKTDCDKGSGIPKEGDNISQLGNRTDSSRQSAIILSAYGSDAPSYKQYSGVGATEPYFSLNGKQVTRLSPYGNELTGVLNIEKGSKGWENFEGLPEEIQKAANAIETIEYGKNNLLLNSGFTGDYVTASLVGSTSLKDKSSLFSPSLKYWDVSGSVVVELSEVSESGYEVSMYDDDVLEQTLYAKVVPNDSYIFSFRGKGGAIRFTFGEVYHQFDMDDENWYTYSHKFQAPEDVTYLRVEAVGDCNICELQLERGNVRSAWGISPLDNRSELAKYDSLTYLQAALKGDTDILGGLINTGLINMGMYDEQGNMTKSTAGINGLYNEDRSIAFWAGGNSEQAVFTEATYLDNPNYIPTQEELNKMAKFVVTHGGRAILNDIILRGYIYALGGRFKGEVSATSGNISGTLEVGEDFTITGTSDVKQGIEYSVENEGLNRYGKFFFRPRSFMSVPRDTLTLEDDVQRNVLMYLERARNNYYDRVLYAKGISEFNGRVAISSKNAKDTTAIPGKPSLFVEDGIGFSGELLCEPRVLSLNSSILSDGFHYLNYIEKSGITVDIQSFRDVDDNLGSMMYIVNTTSGVYTIICATGGFIYGGERKTSVEIGAFSTIMLFKTHSGDVQIAKMS